MNSLTTLITIIMDVLENLMLGSPVLVGFFFAGLFVTLSIVMRLRAIAWFVWILPGTFILVRFGYLPEYFKVLALIVYGIIFSFGVYRVVQRR